MTKIFEEAEWFEEFYPKEWGNWREAYNLDAFVNQSKDGRRSACTWMDYSKTGWLMGEVDGMMEVIPHIADPKYYESFFIESDDPYFCQPYLQPKDNTHYLKVTARYMESNLELYVIHVAGQDDCSYTRHCLGLDDMLEAIEDLKKYGTSNVLASNEYFFSN